MVFTVPSASFCPAPAIFLVAGSMATTLPFFKTYCHCTGMGRGFVWLAVEPIGAVLELR